MSDFDDDKFQREAPERMRRLADRLLSTAENQEYGSLTLSPIAHAAAALFAASYAGPVIAGDIYDVTGPVEGE